jgi:hypothetical protein
MDPRGRGMLERLQGPARQYTAVLALRRRSNLGELAGGELRIEQSYEKPAVQRAPSWPPNSPVEM